MGEIINIQFCKSKNEIINKLRVNRETFFELDEKTKYDYALIGDIFNEFRYDLAFLERVLDDVTQNVKEDWTFEFNIRYLRLLEAQKQYNVRGYLVKDPVVPAELKIKVFGMTVSAQANIMMGKLKRAIENTNAQSIGMGFIVILEMFSYSDVIKDYYAEEFVRSIFQNPNIESFLHQTYESFEEIEKTGLMTFIINYVATRDESLAYYFINHAHVLGEINYVLECIKSNWELYIRSEESDIFTAISNDIFMYVHEQKNNSLEPNMSVAVDRIWEAAYYAAYELGNLETFYEQVVGHDPVYVKRLGAKFENLNVDNESPEFKMHYKSIRGIIQSHFKQITDLSYQLKVQRKDDTKH